MQHFDTLIVGQGIAGSLVAYQLHKRHQSFRVLDAGHVSSASRIAAGMFTPVSGKRKTVHNNYFEQAKLAIKNYREIELLLGNSILHAANVYQLFENEAEKQLFADKALLPEYSDILLPDFPTPAGINNGEGGVAIGHSGWVDCPLFITAFRQWLQNRQLLIADCFEYAALLITGDFFHYNGLRFRNIIFCEGYRAATNIFFKDVIIPCKGDIISIAIDGADTTSIIKRNAFYMLPAADGINRVGATFKWHNSDEALYETDRQDLEQAAASILRRNSFKTLSHHSAIRATTPGQRVIAKAHPSIKNMFMLNGLGAKGILLGPGYAAQLAQAIIDSSAGILFITGH